MTSGVVAGGAKAAGAGARPGETMDTTAARLDDQIKWYSAAASRSRRGHWTLRMANVGMAAAIPVTAALQLSSVVAALLGAGIVVSEGAHELFRLQQNWTSYRATAEALKHEKYLYLAGAGPYRHTRDAHVLLAERVEGLVSSETAQWVAVQQSQGTTSDASGTEQG